MRSQSVSARSERYGKKEFPETKNRLLKILSKYGIFFLDHPFSTEGIADKSKEQKEEQKMKMQPMQKGAFMRGLDHMIIKEIPTPSAGAGKDSSGP